MKKQGINTNEKHCALDILASVVSNVQEYHPKKNLPEHRVSCHRCGNIRKRKLLCPRQTCPHIFCGRCADKMLEEHGGEVFADGCPVCQELCCCSNKSVTCNRQNHCYRKCPSTKGKVGLKADDSPAESDYHISAPALEILAQVVSDPFRTFSSSRPASPGAEVKKRKYEHTTSPYGMVDSDTYSQDQQIKEESMRSISPSTSTSGHHNYSLPPRSSELNEQSPKGHVAFPTKPYTPDAASLLASYAMSSLSALSAAAGNYDQCTLNIIPRTQLENSPKSSPEEPEQNPTLIPQFQQQLSPPHYGYSQHTFEDGKYNLGIPGKHNQFMSSYPSHPQYMATAAAAYESYAPAVPKKVDSNPGSS